MFLQSMNTDIVSSRGTSLDEAIKLSATYFDEKSKTSKLLILILMRRSFRRSTSSREANKLGMRIVTVGIEQKGGTIPLKVNGIYKATKGSKR
jgi:Ca-activated chloride channel family protein